MKITLIFLEISGSSFFITWGDVASLDITKEDDICFSLLWRTQHLSMMEDCFHNAGKFQVYIYMLKTLIKPLIVQKKLYP